jgi:ergothioneine biosynthesis protein EgtB
MLGTSLRGVPSIDDTLQRDRLLTLYDQTRRQSLDIAAPLSPEDQTVQSMPDASPTKWHLAHTTWFFETFLVLPFVAGAAAFDTRYGYLFNSYYETLGRRQPRPERGLLTRPPLDEVIAYRRHADRAMRRLIETCQAGAWPTIAPLIALGINHEQQHQELMLTDILHLLACSPLCPPYRQRHSADPPHGHDVPARWVAVGGGIHAIGHAGGGFAFDNEGPRHDVVIRPFRLAAGLVTNGEWRAFIADDGYRRPELWLADGWAKAQENDWQAPLYWRSVGDGGYAMMTLDGLQPVADAAPVCHVSYYEADAFARWSGRRLPTEAEWEVAAAGLAPVGNTLGSGRLTPVARTVGEDDEPPRLAQVFGDVWEWTQSAYVPYPGYRPPAGAVGEYNGKFMCNQMVLRGGSCVTPDGHIRASYRNFFYPHQRWQFSGVRLAEDG